MNVLAWRDTTFGRTLRIVIDGYRVRKGRM